MAKSAYAWKMRRVTWNHRATSHELYRLPTLRVSGSRWEIDHLIVFFYLFFYVRTPIKRFTATGIETEDGTHREVDAIICATGAEIKQSALAPRFPITVAGTGKSLTDVWKAHGHPYTYLGTATPGFPNLYFVLDPHASGPSGTVPYSVETQISHLARLLNKIATEGVRSIVPSAEAADEFEAWATAFFKSTVFSESCRSWYNAGNPAATSAACGPAAWRT